MALVAMLGAVPVAVIMVLMAVMIMAVMIMPAAAGIAVSVGLRARMSLSVIVSMLMPVLMGVSLGVGVSMGMPMVVMVMMMVVVAAAAGVVMRVGVAVIIGAALGLERPIHGAHRAALATDHLGQHMVVLDIDRVRRDLGRGVAVADMPGDAHQAQRVLGADLEQGLRRGLDQHEPAILQLHGVAIGERGRLVEIEQDVEPAIALERETAAIAILMVEGQRIDDAICPDRGLANDGGGAQHDDEPVT